MDPRHGTVLRVTAEGYAPDDEKGRKQHAKLKVGSLVGARIARSRSVQQQRLYWGVLNAVVKVAGDWDTPEALHNACKVETDHVEVVRLIDGNGRGRLIKVPQSTAFDEMTQDEFNEYSRQAFEKICTKILGGISLEELFTMAERSEGPLPAWKRETNAAAQMIEAGSLGG